MKRRKKRRWVVRININAIGIKDPEWVDLQYILPRPAAMHRALNYE